MKRKIRALFFRIGIAGSLLLGGCGKEEKEPVTITMIHAWGGTGEDHVAMRNIINLRLDITHLYYPAKNSFQKGRLKRREIFTELLLYTLTT